MRQKVRGCSKHSVGQISQVQRNLTQEIAITTQRQILKDGKKILDVSIGKLFATDAESSSQGWQKGAVLDEGTEKPVATEEDQEHLNSPEDSVSTGKIVAPGYPGTQGNSGTEGNDED